MKNNQSWRHRLREAAKQWWTGASIGNDSKLFTWQQMTIIDDMGDGFRPMGSRKELKDKLTETFGKRQLEQTGLLFKHLFTGRRIWSSIVCTVVIPVLPLELIFRPLNAVVETWHRKVWEEDYGSKSGWGKAWWVCRAAASGIAKVCARVTDFLIVTPANGLRTAVDAVSFGVIPICPIIDACKAAYQAHNAVKEEKQGLKQGAKQFFIQFGKSWLSGVWATIKGICKAARPVAIAATAGIAVPFAGAASTVSVVSNIIPHAGQVIGPGISVATSAPMAAVTYLPGLASAAGSAGPTAVTAIQPVIAVAAKVAAEHAKAWRKETTSTRLSGNKQRFMAPKSHQSTGGFTTSNDDKSTDLTILSSRNSV